MGFDPVFFLWHVVFSSVFLLALYTGVIALRIKQKSFFYYFLYAFFLGLYLLIREPYQGQTVLETNSQILLVSGFWYIQIIYNSIYYLFFIHFVDLKKHLPTLTRFLYIFIGITFTVGTIIELISLIIDNHSLIATFFYYVFSPLSALVGLGALYFILKIPGQLKYFAAVGSLSYLLLGITALITSFIPNYNLYDTFFAPINFFYAGVLIEQIAFGLGLAYKIELLNNERLEKTKQNDLLTQRMNEKLQVELAHREEEIKAMQKAADEARITEIKSAYNSELHRVQLSNLQSKMNPHFIFNALNSIKVYLIENDKNKATAYLNRFAKLMRKILDGSRVEASNLEDELETLKLYLEIENSRFDEEIEVSFPVLNAHLSQIKMPPLILQPFAENAIWHGLAPITDKKRKIWVELKLCEKNYCLLICDNGIGPHAASKKAAHKVIKRKSHGLKITQERLDVFNQKYHTNYSFSIRDRAEYSGEQGAEVVFVLDNK